MTVLQHGPAHVARYALKCSCFRVKQLLSGDAETVAQIKREVRAASVAIETDAERSLAGWFNVASVQRSTGSERGRNDQ